MVSSASVVAFLNSGLLILHQNFYSNLPGMKSIFGESPRESAGESRRVAVSPGGSQIQTLFLLTE